MKFLNVFFCVLCILFNCSTNLIAQFTGGNASGFASATSANQQLNPPLFNDLQIGYITLPTDNQNLNINTSYNLDFNVENLGSLPVYPNDSIFFTVTINADLLIDSFFFLSPDTLLPATSANILFSNILNFSDSSSNAQMCITLNGTSFASDSVVANNSHCNTINIIDPSGINTFEKENISAFYNATNKCIIMKNMPEIQKVFVYDIMGRKIPFILKNENLTEYSIELKVNFPMLIFLNVFSENSNFAKNFIVF